MNIEILKTKDGYTLNGEYFKNSRGVTMRIEKMINESNKENVLNVIANKLCGNVDNLKNMKTLYRQIFCYLARKENITLECISKSVGYKPPFICNSIKKIGNYIEVKDKETLSILENYYK